MICDNCKKDRLLIDFINSTNICYKCVYQKKLEKVVKKRTPKPKFCRICNKEVVYLKNHNKRQRTVFCSTECAEIGRKENRNGHWTKKICANNCYEIGI